MTDRIRLIKLDDNGKVPVEILNKGVDWGYILLIVFFIMVAILTAIQVVRYYDIQTDKEIQCLRQIK